MLQLIAFRDTIHMSQVLSLRFNAKFAGNLVILQFSAITEAILPIKASHHPQISQPYTGATSHITSELANLDLANPYQGSDIITTASGAGQTHRNNPSQGAV
ncbi:hypothetical protein ACFX1Q_043685 [Malus domestica]